MSSADALIEKSITERDSVTVRFAGDSGDGMQLIGTQFTNVAAIFGNDISTLPDFPAEIRAPAGTLAGVSGYQIQFSSQEIFTPGDAVDALVAMNPAALKANLSGLKKGGLLLVNEDAFAKGDLAKATYDKNPLETGELSSYQLIRIPMTRLNRNAVEDVGISLREQDRCKNFFALGIVFWLYNRSLEPTINWVSEKFAKLPKVVDANISSLKAGYHFGETTELITANYRVPKAVLKAGKYRKITGNEATALGMVTTAVLADKDLLYATYPITPASDILHELARLKNFRVRTFQAEDEIAAVSAAIGGSFGGVLSVTGTSGPGVALKAEAIGLAVMTELPLVVIDVQRGGPSTGLPTKTEQSDLFQVLYGRNGECPVAVLAPATPGECFYMIQEAFRLAVEYMTPVFFMSDGYLANGAEPWLIPEMKDLPQLKIQHPGPVSNGDSTDFEPYQRNDQLRRPWAIPGTAGLEHRIGGLEKQDITGNVSYDPENHHQMCEIRAAKIAGIANNIPDLEVEGPEEGDILLLGWGGTYGAIASAARSLRESGKKVSHAHLRYLNPMPKNTQSVLGRFRTVLIPELNLGQLCKLIRSEFLVDPIGFNKVKGQPFLVSEIVEKVNEILES